MGGLITNSEDRAPQKFDKEHMQGNLKLNWSAVELERSSKNNATFTNSSICLSDKMSKSSDPLHNVHIVQFKVTKGSDRDGWFNGYIGLTSETNVPMLNQECVFYE